MIDWKKVQPATYAPRRVPREPPFAWPPTPEETVALELLKGEMHEIEAEIRSHVSTVVVF